jgi:predicted MFS family arabinose efflux permease
MNENKTYYKNYRWVALMAYFCVAAMSQMLWLNFAPLVSFVQQKYQVSELTVSSLLLSFPLLYVILSIHSGTMIDKKGYRHVIILGSIITSTFACLRIFDSNFYFLLIAQTGIAVGQPYIINGISKLISDWFPKEQTALATGLGTVGMLIGMAIGMGLTPVLNNSIGFNQTMIVFAIISLALTGIFILFGKENQLVKHNKIIISGMNEVKLLLKNKNLLVLFIVCFLALGVFNGLTTWLEAILKPNGINAEQAGLAGAFLIIGGIAGSVIIPGLSDRFRVRKPFLALCCLTALLILYPLCTLSSITLVYLLGGLMGFFFLPGYALLLSMCEEIAGTEKAGTATGLLMMAGNAGAVFVIILMPLVNGTNSIWTNAIYFIIILMSITLTLVLKSLKETFAK